jgi:hypothetical protein
MNTQTEPPSQPLAKGQLWRTAVAAIEIVALGRRFIHYEITMLLGRKRVSAQTSDIEAMANYLHTHEARLVRSPG